MPTDDKRHQQTPPDVLKQCLSVYFGVWGCLFVSFVVCCCLLASPAPWRCLVGVWRMSGGRLGVSESHSWKLEALGCVWGYLGSQSLQYGVVTLFCHNPETKEYFAPETYWTPKTKTSQYMLSKNHWVCPFLKKFVAVREILQYAVSLDHPVV